MHEASFHPVDVSHPGGSSSPAAGMELALCLRGVKKQTSLAPVRVHKSKKRLAALPAFVDP